MFSFSDPDTLFQDFHMGLESIRLDDHTYQDFLWAK